MKYLKHILVCFLVLASAKGQIITTIAGNGMAGYNGDNISATSAEFSIPNGNAIDQFGNVFIADAGNNRVRKINVSSGIITTIAGNGTMGYSGDGGQATAAELSAPTGVAFDNTGNLYVADFYNQVIRKVITSTGIITTIAGTGTLGYSGNGGQATSAQLSSPRQLAFDTSGNLYICDEGNYVIRKIITSTGIIITAVGTNTQGYSGDGGQATSAEINNANAITTDIAGNLYIADSDNNVIRKVISSTGIITTIIGNGYNAGTGNGGYSGDGGAATAAELYVPEYIVLDSLGNLYISDSFNSVIRKVNTAGIIYTIAGTGAAGFSGDGGLSINAELKYPCGIALYVNNLYVVDYGNNRVRKVSNVSSITGVEQWAVNSEQLSVYPNPATDVLNVECLLVNEKSTLEITDMLGNTIYHSTFSTQHNTINISNLSEGMYLLRVLQNGNAVYTTKVIKED
jgi:hypothetical protein